MGKELMWACALLPEEINQEIVAVCERANQEIGLPEKVFRFPLHISLKKSWECDRFLDAQRDVAEYLKRIALLNAAVLFSMPSNRSVRF